MNIRFFTQKASWIFILLSGFYLNAENNKLARYSLDKTIDKATADQIYKYPKNSIFSKDAVVQPNKISSNNNQYNYLGLTPYCITNPIKVGNSYLFYGPNGKPVAKVDDQPGKYVAQNTQICYTLDYNPSFLPSILDVPMASINYEEIPYAPRHWSISVPQGENVLVTLYLSGEEVNALQQKAEGTMFQFGEAQSLVMTSFNNTYNSEHEFADQGGVDIRPIIASLKTEEGDYWGATINVSSSKTIYIHPQSVNNMPEQADLLGFLAVPKKDMIQLDWFTESEVNNNRFIVERSQDGTNNYIAIGEVNGAGSSKERNDYCFFDDEAKPNTQYYYRLRKVNNNGASALSYVVPAKSEKLLDIMISDFAFNPARRFSGISIQAKKQTYVSVSFFAPTGENIFFADYMLDKGLNDLSFDFLDLHAGIYYCMIDTPEGQIVRKLVKIKA